MNRLSVPQILLLVAGFLAPLIGGYVASDKTEVGASLVEAMEQGQAPVLQHALLALPLVVALAMLLAGRRVQQIPHPYVAAILMAFVASLAPAVAVSSYRALSINVWIEWAVYAVAFLACVSGLGRRIGPTALLASIFAGTVWIAFRCVLEYGEMRGIDPTWRVFGGWSNPNATAAMLTLGLFCGLSLGDVKERLAGLAVVLGGGFILFALFLTGSKGALLFALPLGIVAYAVVGAPKAKALWVVAALAAPLIALGFLKGWIFVPILLTLFMLAGLRRQGAFAVRAYLAVAVGVSLIALLNVTSLKGASAGVTPGSRVVAATKTQDQSSTFRLNLWKSAATLAKERPVTGWGLGSYRYESARPGLSTATVFAHNTYLQLAAEAGLGAAALFVAFLAVWGRRSLRGLMHLPNDQRLRFAAAVGGIVAILAHCTVDSDLSYFGLGLAFFLTLGAATLLAADAVAPEFVPRPSRLMAAAGVGLLGAFYLYLGWSDLTKSSFRYAQNRGEAADATSIESLAGWDGDAAYLWALAQPSAEERERGLRRAVELSPTPKNARALARVQAQTGNNAAAESSLRLALGRDPNNMLALSQLIEVQKAEGFADRALETARRLVAVENGPYFKIRSLDQLVPTETYLARLTLAEAEHDPRKKAVLLAEAVRGLRRYADVTVPQILHAEKSGMDFAGETLDSSRRKLALGAEAARAASALFRRLGDPASAKQMDDDAAVFEKTLPAS